MIRPQNLQHKRTFNNIYSLNLIRFIIDQISTANAPPLSACERSRKKTTHICTRNSCWERVSGSLRSVSRARQRTLWLRWTRIYACAYSRHFERLATGGIGTTQWFRKPRSFIIFSNRIIWLWRICVIYNDMFDSSEAWSAYTKENKMYLHNYTNYGVWLVEYS